MLGTTLNRPFKRPDTQYPVTPGGSTKMPGGTMTPPWMKPSPFPSRPTTFPTPRPGATSFPWPASQSRVSPDQSLNQTPGRPPVASEIQWQPHQQTAPPPAPIAPASPPQSAGFTPEQIAKQKSLGVVLSPLNYRGGGSPVTQALAAGPQQPMQGPNANYSIQSDIVPQPVYSDQMMRQRFNQNWNDSVQNAFTSQRGVGTEGIGIASPAFQSSRAVNVANGLTEGMGRAQAGLIDDRATNFQNQMAGEMARNNDWLNQLQNLSAFDRIGQGAQQGSQNFLIDMLQNLYGGLGGQDFSGNPFMQNPYNWGGQSQLNWLTL